MNSYFDLEGRLHQPEPAAQTLVPTIVWVPSRWVSILRVFVPGKSRAHWMAALPYALEEQLAQTLDEVHLVALDRDKQGLVTVAVVEKQRMQTWVDVLRQANLNQVWLVPECFSMAYSVSEDAKEEGSWLIGTSQIEPESYLVRSGRYQGFSLTKAQWPMFLQQAQQQNHSLEVSQASQDMTLNPSALRPFNLRQGEFAVVSANKGKWRAWRWPAGLVAVWLVLVGVQTHWQTQQTLAQAQAYQQQTEALFRQLFPQTQRIVNIQVQTQSFLNQSGQQGTELAPVALLALVEPHLVKKKVIQPGRLDWHNGGLSLRLSASSTEPLEQFLNRVRADLPTGSSARLQIQNVASNKVEATLHVNAN